MRSQAPFNAVNVPLFGRNLIEASAGTGKTYSVALLLLRVLLSGIALKKIVILTFTKAAVAELKERVRTFIKSAYSDCNGHPASDSLIRQIVQEATLINGLEKVRALLGQAVAASDELQIATLHGFAQRTLEEYALETGQFLAAEQLADTEELVLDQVRRFWRTNVTGFPVKLLRQLVEDGYSVGSITQVVNRHLAGKKYFKYRIGKKHDLAEIDFTSAELRVAELSRQAHSYQQQAYSHLEANKPAYEKFNKPAALIKLIAFIDYPDEFLSQIFKKRETRYVADHFSELISLVGRLEEIKGKIINEIRALQSALNCVAIDFVTTGINEAKEKKGLFDYDDLITRLHSELTKPENDLKNLLRDQYSVLFVDEFQDTDQLQYEILDLVFEKPTLSFFIGDPKQSIYGWRKADLNMYFRAARSADHRYTMLTNHRSTPQYVEAMNSFFLPEHDFDTFFYESCKESIDYVAVRPASVEKPRLVSDGKEHAMTFYSLNNKEEIEDAVVSLVVNLLTDTYSLVGSGTARQVEPSDIGILVRTNAEGRDLYHKLALAGIQVSGLAAEPVLRSEEARYFIYVLQAMVTPNLPSVRKALLSPLTGLGKPELAAEENTALERFLVYKARWETQGVYSALHEFLNRYGLHRKVGAPLHRVDQMETVQTLVEIAQVIEFQKAFHPLTLVSWFTRAYEGRQSGEPALEELLSSSSKTVQGTVRISTIHNSKGLEFGIVIAPYLDFLVDGVARHASFVDETGNYISKEVSLLESHEISLQARQTEQENRRLLYVALTRAISVSFIFKNSYSKYRDSTLAVFTSNVQYEDFPAVPAAQKKSLPVSQNAPSVVRQASFRLKDPNWSRVSFSSLAEHRAEQIGLPERATSSNGARSAYDTFVFDELPRGVTTGNLLHHLLERVKFEETSNWLRLALGSTEKYGMSPKLAPKFGELLEQIGGAVLNGFTLSEIREERCIHELDFAFSFESKSLSSLSELCNENNVEGNCDRIYRMSGESYGLFSGQVDLMFEHNDSYYLVDYKSNYLGGSLEDYGEAPMRNAMLKRNYNLQSLIYTVALDKYLKSRLSKYQYPVHFGGVFYLFIRGLRKGKEQGVYHKRWSPAEVSAASRLLGSHS